MKIDPSVKYRDLPDHFCEHLNFIDTDQIRYAAFAFTFVMLDFLLILPILYPPHPLTFWLTIPLLGIINLWTLAIFVRKPEKLRFEIIIFIAWATAIGSFCNFVLAQKMAYFVLGVDSPAFFIVTLAGYIALILQQIWFHWKKYASVKNNFGVFKDLPWHHKLLCWSVPTGYMVAHFAMNTSEYAGLSLVTSAILGLSSIFTYISVKFFHKYRFMKTNESYLDM
ncbi:hypothetical protein ACFQPF_13045 [Fictibacillus iocasae]|uniref:GtrA-like protein domain-containing protein n=1 Tax=Fictibacillus iocasae TaxID=2715437 RepID=A0ABW2NRX5_9BACL